MIPHTGKFAQEAASQGEIVSFLHLNSFNIFSNFLEFSSSLSLRLLKYSIPNTAKIPSTRLKAADRKTISLRLGLAFL